MFLKHKFHASLIAAIFLAAYPLHAATGADPGAAVYAKRCAICHGANREGSLPAFPPLQGISHRYSNDQLTALIHTGKGRMPGFPKLEGDDLTNLLNYLSAAPAAPVTASAGTKESPEAA